MNRLAAASATGETLVRYDEIGSRVLTKERGNGIVEERSYVADLRHLASFSQAAHSSKVDERSYERTPMGLKRKVTIPLQGLVRDYAFDRTGWIELETETNVEGQQELIASYEIDRAFNYERIERIVQSPAERSEELRLFTADDRNRYTAVNDAVPEWDANGNLVSWQGAGLQYDAWNRLVGVSFADGRQLTLVRDGSGNVVRRSLRGSGGTTTLDRIVWENDVLEEWSAGTLVGRYVYGREIDEIIRAEIIRGGQPAILYPLQDELQNVLTLTDANGSILERYRYDGYGDFRAFDAEGEALRAPSQPWSRFFQGREALPGLRAYDFRNRVLWPELGRFGQEDPLGFSDSPNLYQAMLGNPAAYSDPLGLAVETDDPYGLDTGKQAHVLWLGWVEQIHSPWLGERDVDAFYDRSISKIYSLGRQSRAPFSSRLRPDLVGLSGATRLARVWELKPKSYEAGYKLTQAIAQKNSYLRALAPAVASSGTALHLAGVEWIGQVAHNGRPHYMLARVNRNTTHRGLVFYELVDSRDRLKERVLEVARSLGTVACVGNAIQRGGILGTLGGTVIGGVLFATAPALAAPGVGIVAAPASGVVGSVIGGIGGGVAGTVYGLRWGLENCD
jgi:RHS repeat-associated protein